MTTPSVLYKILSTSCIKDVPPCRLHSIFSSMLQETESQLSDDRRPIATVAPSTSPDVSNFLKHCRIIQKGARMLEMCRLDTLYDHLIPFSRWNRRARTLKSLCTLKCKIYSRTVVNRTLRGNEKQFELAENLSYWGNFQWNFEQGKENLVRVSREVELSAFELSRFYSGTSAAVLNSFIFFFQSFSVRSSSISSTSSMAPPQVNKMKI